MKHIIIIGLLAVTACAPQQGQNRYSQAEAGKQTELETGRVVSVKQVAITGENTGMGMNAGMAAGAVGGAQIGDGNGQLAAVVAGALIGAIAGHIAEQELAEKRGYEYIVKVDGMRKLRSVVQYQNKDDVVFKKGDKVFLQGSGQYQRVMTRE